MSVIIHSRTRQPGLVNTLIQCPIVPITINGIVNEASVSPGSSLTIAHQVVSGNNRCLFVTVAQRGYGSVTGIQWNGTALTQIATEAADNYNTGRTDLWFLTNPEVGSFNIVITLSSAEWAEACVINFDNVNQATPYTNLYSTTGSSNQGYVSNTNTAGNLAMATISHEGIGTESYGPPVSDFFNLSSDGNWWGAAAISEEHTADLAGFSWDFSINAWAMIFISIQKA